MPILNNLHRKSTLSFYQFKIIVNILFQLIEREALPVKEKDTVESKINTRRFQHMK